MSQGNNDNYADSRRGETSNNNPGNLLSEAGQFHRRPMSRHFGDQRANSLLTKMKELAEQRIQSDGVTKFSFIMLPSDQSGLPMSVIMITQSGKSAQKLFGSIFSVFIENEDTRIPTFSEKDPTNGQPIDIPRTTADLVNSREYWSLAVKTVTSLVGQGTWVEAGSERIAAQKIENEEHYLTSLLFQATRATFSSLSNQIQISQEKPYTLIRRNTSEILTARLNTQGGQMFNLNGEPIRSDIIIELNSGRSGESFVANERLITEVRGFIEPIHAQPAPQGSLENQPFFPMFVQTHIESGYDALDREMMLLALFTSTLIESYSSWAGPFRPRFRQALGNKAEIDGIDLKDIGGTGYAIGTGDRFTIREEQPGSTFADVIKAVFRPRVIYAIDIPEMGGNAWAFDMFRAAAANIASANQAIEDAVDNLTGKKFSPLWAPHKAAGVRIIDSLNVRIPLGYYNDPKSQGRRSLYDVDQLAAINIFGKSNPKSSMEFAETYDPKGKSANLRMHKRLTLGDEILGHRQIVTNMANRYVFTPLFMQIGVQACAAAGLVVQPGNIASAGLSGGAIMGGFDVSGYASNGAAGAGIYGGGSGTGQATGAYSTGRTGWAN